MTDATTVEERLRARYDWLTRAERQVAAALLESYPALGLSSITHLAATAKVSTPTVLRLVHKLDYEGFGAFQDALRAELQARVSGPIDKRAVRSVGAPGGHILNRFAEAVVANLQGTLTQVESETFDATVKTISDPQRRVFVTGGRITRALADYLFTHLQVLRPGVTQLGTAPGVWPHYLLDIAEGDVLVLFDIRRYETVLQRLAELAHARGAQIVLFTDQWGSPIAPLAQYRFACRVEAPSAWDSTLALLFVAEALIGAVEERGWPQARERMQTLESIFDQTRLFRKFT
ncbi:MAG: MurR/RpiR family transcriptional regulator, partial [Dichotomicrobium sp.]